MHTLGIDFGSDVIGLAVVDRRADSVCELIELQLRSDIKERMEERRALRRFRRQRKRYRRPVEPARDGGRTAPPPYNRASGQNRRNLMKCCHVDPATGAVCGRNAPLKKNIRPELMAQTLANIDVPDRLKQDLLAALTPKPGDARRPADIFGEFRARRIPDEIIRRIDTLLHGSLPGRSDFCREHLDEYGGDWPGERHAMTLSNSVLAKHDALISLLRKLGRKYTIDRIVIEDSNFDPDLIRPGRLLDSSSSEHAGFLKKNTFKAMQHEYFNRCCYCGKEGSSAILEIDHVIPKSMGGAAIWENLALACRECNSEKGWRTPQDAGMDFYELEGVVVAGVPRRVHLKPVQFERSRAFRYIGKTDPGKRILRGRISELLPDAEIKLDYGYRTSFFRNRWQWEKTHCYDAAVLAAEKNSDRPDHAPELDAEKKIIKLKPGSGKLFDAYPVAKKKDAFVQKRTLISRDGRIAQFTWGEIRRVTSPDKQRVLEKLRDPASPEETGDSDPIPDELLETLPFRCVTLARKDVGESSVRKIGCNYFKAEQPNWGTAVYMDKNGKKNFYMIRNARAFGKTKPPADCAKLLFVVRKGDMVKFTYKKLPLTETVYANFSNGNLKLVRADGSFILKSAKSCTPAGRDEF